MKSHLITLLFIFICSLSANAQHNVRLYDLLNELKYATQDTAKADILIKLAKEYASIDVTKTIGKAEIALMIANNLNDEQRLFTSLIILSEANYQRQNLNAAAKYLSQAQQLKKVLQNSIQKAKLLGIEGKIFLALEEYEKAAAALQQQQKIYEADSNWAKSIDIANTYFELGELNYIQNSYNEAIYYYLKSLNIRKALNDNQSTIEVLNALGKTHLKIKNFQKGLDFCNEALFLTDPLVENNLLGDIYLHLASALDELNNKTDAIQKLDKAQIIAENRNNAFQLAKIKLKRGNIYEKSSENNLALAQYQEAIQLAEKAGNKALKREIFEVVYQYYDKIGDIRNAYLSLKNLTSIRDSLRSEEQSKQYIINKIRFETEKKEQENQKLIAKQLENDITIQRQRTSNYILLVLLLAGTIAGYAL
ncbi:MAG: tetratricopeptide repeat protein [Saprospiraceae bacterium]